MNSLRPTFEQRGLDLIHWQQMMNRHPQEYIRRKLRAIHAYAQGQSVNILAYKFAIHPNTLRHYITTYCLGGFELLCQPEKRPQPKRLTPQQEADFKQILLKKRPNDCGLTGNIWTGQLMCQYLTATYQVDYRSGIYDLLERLNLSHQKAHADYGNADPVQQQTFLNEFKNSLLSSDNTHAVVVYDEFSVAEKPTSYYGWAEKNTATADRPPSTPNGRKKSERLNGLLAIDLGSAECFFSATATADALVIAQYMIELASDLQQRGYEYASVYLDRNTTHLKRMQTAYIELSKALTIQMQFVHFSAYSPALNPVEYAIHWIGQHSLHQANCDQCLAEVKQRLVDLLDHQVVLSQIQLINILVHIEKLVEYKQKHNLSP